MIKVNDTISKVLLTIDQYKANLDALKQAVIDDEYSAEVNKNYTRLLVWKATLITGSLKIQTWNSHLSNSRVVYHKLVQQEKMVVPWWRLDPDSYFYQSKNISRKSSINRSSSIRRAKTLKNNLTKVQTESDPLTHQSKTNPSNGVSTKSYSSTSDDLELLNIIILDIDRLFPGEPFFHSSNPGCLENKRQMIEILYIWVQCNPQVGYKQGIHEILGLLFISLHRESLEIPNTNTNSAVDLSILSLYDVCYLPHDLFTIFNKFMLQSGIITKFYANESVLLKTIEYFNINLMKIDQLIHYNLVSKLKIESQLWIIRYLRLIFLRELDDIETSGLLWEKLICVRLSQKSSSTMVDLPDMIVFLTIVLLLHVKSELITCDFSEGLSLLLHYPISMIISKTTRTKFVSHLITYAIKLYERRDNDLKLYECGIALNSKLNPNLKINMIYKGPPAMPRQSDENSLESQQSLAHSRSKSEELKFEKLRLEMRLKKKAHQMTRH